MQGKHPTVTVGGEAHAPGKKGFRMCPRPARCCGETRRLGDKTPSMGRGEEATPPEQPGSCWIYMGVPCSFLSVALHSLVYLLVI